MRRTIVALDPYSQQRSLLVEVHCDPKEPVTQEALRAFYNRLFHLNIHVGLLMTPTETHVVRDLLTSMDPSDNRYEDQSLPTDKLVSHAGLGPVRTDNAFYAQIKRWLEAVGTSWFSYLHPAAVELMVPDVIGSLAQATLEDWGDVKEHGDAA